MTRLPVIHDIEELDYGGRFQIERLNLEFSNGERRLFDRLRSRGHGAVIIAALADADTVLLIREYAAGLHRYELGLPKGRIDPGETPEQAAQRELKEEAGYGARRLTCLRSLSLVPTFMNHQTWLVLAEDLYPERLPGDEPEPLEVVPWKFAQLHELMLREECSEGRSLAALFIAREFVRQRQSSAG